MDYNYYDDYLMHYGVKGMKWGVRRYQNSDGTLTAKGKKRLANNERYREKLANKAAKRSKYYETEAKEAEARSADLQKHGSRSETYKNWQKEQREKRAKEFEDKHSVTGPDGKKYVRKYDDDFSSLCDDLFDSASADSKVQDPIDENNKTARRSRESAKNWAKTNENLMNMRVSALAEKKNDIRKTYWS